MKKINHEDKSTWPPLGARILVKPRSDVTKIACRWIIAELNKFDGGLFFESIERDRLIDPSDVEMWAHLPGETAEDWKPVPPEVPHGFALWYVPVKSAKSPHVDFEIIYAHVSENGELLDVFGDGVGWDVTDATLRRELRLPEETQFPALASKQTGGEL